MKTKTIKITIDGIDGYYFVEDYELIFYCNNQNNEIQVSDLTELKVWEYNQLVDKLNDHYPDFTINYLEGKYV